MTGKGEGGPDTSAAQLFAAEAGRLAAEYDRQGAAMLASDAPEATHRARVALRRLRSLVAGFAPILADRARKQLEKRLQAAFRALGPLRDADVRALALADTADAAMLRAAADGLRAELRARLRAEAGPGLEAELAAVLADPGLWRDSPRARRLAAAPPQVLARRALQAAWSDVLAYGDDLAALDTESLHDFRKDMKALRYLGEAFAPAWPRAAQGEFRARMQKLQDALGTLNDLVTVLNADAGGVPPDLPASLAGRQRAAMAKASKHWRKLRAAGPWWHAGAAGETGS